MAIRSIVLLIVLAHTTASFCMVRLNTMKYQYATLMTDAANNEQAIRNLFAEAEKFDAGKKWVQEVKPDFEAEIKAIKGKRGIARARSRMHQTEPEKKIAAPQYAPTAPYRKPVLELRNAEIAEEMRAIKDKYKSREMEVSQVDSDRYEALRREARRRLAEKTEPDKKTEQEEKETKSAAQAVSESKIFPNFNAWKAACDKLPFLVHENLTKSAIDSMKNGSSLSDSVYKGNKPAGLDFEEFNRVLEQFCLTMKNSGIMDAKNWVNARITDWETRVVPTHAAVPMPPDLNFFNLNTVLEGEAAKKFMSGLSPMSKTYFALNGGAPIARESYVQKITIPVNSTVVLHGDLHGDVHGLLSSLTEYLDGNRGFKLKKKVFVFFLGDYVDRGLYGFENIYTLMRLVIDNPGKVFATRGNHEDREISSGYGFKAELESKKIKPNEIEKIYRMYDLLPAAIFLGSGNNFVQLCHGGLEPGFDTKLLLNSEGAVRYQWLNELNRQSALRSMESAIRSSNPRALADHIVPTPGDTAIGWVGKKLNTIFLGFCWSDFLVRPGPSEVTGRGISLNEDITKKLFELNNSNSTKKLSGVIRAHQHSNEWNDMMTLLLDRNNQDPENKGIAKLWSDKAKKGNKLWQGIVVTLNVSPDMLYGLPGRNWPGFDFDTTCELTTGTNFEDWTLNVIRKQITKLPKS